MKKILNLLAIVTILSFVLAACGGQAGRKDTRNDMSNFSEGMQEVIQNIDEAIAANDISEFKNKTDDAVGSLDKKIDDYLNEMDNSERRIEKNTQKLVIDMKQKNVEVELKLALLEHDDSRRIDSGTNGSQMNANRNVTGTNMEGTSPVAQSDRTVAGDRPVSSAERTSIDGDLNRGTDTERVVMYGAQMVDDIKNDLRELKRDVEQFMQTSLAYHENN